MPRGLQSRRTDRQDVRFSPIQRRGNSKRTLPSAARFGAPAPRLIGFPLQVTIPKVKGIRWRYCTRWDEQPAAQLGKSLLRLGICRIEDWSGSAVDFVERGYKRFAKAHGAEDARKIWEGDLRIMDHLFELNERERQQMKAERDSPAELLYLVGDYNASASIPIGPTLAQLHVEHGSLPAAFYGVFVENLWKWMRVYDYSEALEFAEMWIADIEEEELTDSPYPKVEKNIPQCLRKRLNYRKSLRLLEEIQPTLRGSLARQLVRLALEMHLHGKSFEHAWPSKSVKEIPGLEEFLEDADGCGPGCLITWHEDDEINACFDEETRMLGQNGPLEPPILKVIRLNQPMKELDLQVRALFDYAGAMLRSLASGARIVEIVRGIYDEHVRKNRLKSGLQVEPGVAGLRQE